MALTCRKLARNLRAEADAGYPPIHLTAHANQYAETLISRAEAAKRMDEQADRWEHEANTGIENRHDRDKIGW